jgi:hypothetical protein
MLESRPIPAAILWTLLMLLMAPACAQQPATPAPPTTAASGIDRMAGTEPASHIQFARLILKAEEASTSAPLLIAQCTLRPNGKYVFEMFTSFDGTPDLAFYPPWTPSSSHDLFPPSTGKVTLTMEFLGYTHVKPLRRQWEIPVQTPGLYRYNSPSRSSTNMEEVAYDLRYLLALPTLRLTLNNRTSEFLTTPLLDSIRKEPLCRAAGI